jgi:peptidyl-prolyl cis-trans isomerase B (cyclophilin B)
VSRPIVVLVLTAALGLLAAGCGGSDDGGAASPSTAASTAAPSGAGQASAKLPAGCTRVADPGPRDDETQEKRPSGRLSGTRAKVEITTNCGSFTITLAAADAPRTAASFATLVKRGFYDRLTFHRISGDPASGPFVIQGGDPLGTGLGGPGFSVREKPPADLRYTKGTVAMAKTQAEPAGTSGSQFFVVTAADAGLPPDYALVGRVTAGQDVVDRIAQVPADGDEKPVAPVVIQKATLDGASVGGGAG